MKEAIITNAPVYLYHIQTETAFEREKNVFMITTNQPTNQALAAVMGNEQDSSFLANGVFSAFK